MDSDAYMYKFRPLESATFSCSVHNSFPHSRTPGDMSFVFVSPILVLRLRYVLLLDVLPLPLEPVRRDCLYGRQYEDSLLCLCCSIACLYLCRMPCETLSVPCSSRPIRKNVHLKCESADEDRCQESGVFAEDATVEIVSRRSSVWFEEIYLKSPFANWDKVSGVQWTEERAFWLTAVAMACSQPSSRGLLEFFLHYLGCEVLVDLLIAGVEERAENWSFEAALNRAAEKGADWLGI